MSTPPLRSLLGQGGPWAQVRRDLNLLFGTDTSGGTNPFTNPANCNDGNDTTYADRAAYGGGVSIRQQAIGGTYDPVGVSVSLPAASIAGNLLIFTYDEADGDSTIPTGFTRFAAVASFASGARQLGLAYKVSAGETTVGPASSKARAMLYEVAGAGDPTTFEVKSVSDGSGGTKSLGAFTNPGGLQIGRFAWNSTNEDQTAGSGYTQDDSYNDHAGFDPQACLAVHGTAGSTPQVSGPSYTWMGQAVGIVGASADEDSWIEADLGIARRANRIELLEDSNTGTHYVVEYSTDHSSWTTLSPSWSYLGGNRQRYDFAETAARWWRVIDDHPSGGVLTELKWYTLTIEGFPF